MSQFKPVIFVSSSMTLEHLLEMYLKAETDVVFLDEQTVVSSPHLELLTDFPRKTSAVLVGPETEDSDVYVGGGRVLSAKTKSHEATLLNRRFAGAMLVSKSQQLEIQTAVGDAIGRNAAGHPLELLLVALVRAAIVVEAVVIREAPFIRSSDAAARALVQEQIKALNLSKLKLRIANRANDGFFSMLVLRRLSKPLTWLAVKLRATPNQVTLASFAIGLFAAFLFSRGDAWALIGGAVLLQVSLVVDCVDGELARYTRQFSALGAWLDAITDRVKEYAVFLGLAYGAQVQHGQNLWLLAALLMTFQTVRHLSDYNFSQVIKARKSEQPPQVVDFMAEWDGIEKQDETDENEESDPKDLRRRIRYWLGKMVVFPIGERWLVISATAAVGGALFTFIAMPVFAIISMFWVYRRRIEKTVLLPETRIKSDVIRSQLDLGLPLKGYLIRFDWLEPSLLRAVEMLVLIVILFFSVNLGVIGFVILLSIAYHHYDNLYRAMQSEQKPTWLGLLGLGALGRIGIVLAAVLLQVNLEFLAIYFFSLFLLVSSVQWITSHRIKD